IKSSPTRRSSDLQNNRQQTVLETVVEENIGVRRRNNGPETELGKRPGSVLAAGAAAKILARQQNGGALIAVLVQHEIRIERPLGIIHAWLAMVQIAQFVEQVGAKARALDGLEELFGYDQVGIDILTIQRCDQAMMGGKGLHDGFLSIIPYINKMTGNCGGRSHGRADQMRAPALPLATLEIAV